MHTHQFIMPDNFHSLFQRGQKGDTLNALVKIEFGERALGESPKVECSPDNPAEFNHNCTLQVTFEDPMSLDELAYRPIISML